MHEDYEEDQEIKDILQKRMESFERPGDFKPLEYIPTGGSQVILCVFTSTFGELEDGEAIKERIKEASKYVPLEQLCISALCRFASTHHGNKLIEDEQWAKLKFIVDII